MAIWGLCSMYTVLVVGSSIFQAWTNVQAVAPGCLVKNRAVGGTTTAYWVEHLAAALAEVAPDVVLFYCGSNDLNAEVLDSLIVENVGTCWGIVRQMSEETRFVYFSIIKAPQKYGKWERIDDINAQIRLHLPDGALYIESNAVFFKDGRPVEKYFVEDGLHLTDEAYDTLCDYARPLLAAHLEDSRADSFQKGNAS